MDDIQRASTDVQNMNPADYGNVSVEVLLKEHGKYLPEVIIDLKNYQIKPLTCQIIPKPGGKTSAPPLTFKPSGSAFFASGFGVNHAICLDCGNMYHKEDSKEIRDRIAAGKESYHLTTACNTNVDEARMKIIEIIQNVFCKK